MATPNVYIRTIVDLVMDGEHYTAGDAMSPVSITLGGDEITSDSIKVATSTAVKVWDKDESQVGDFDFLYLACDYDLRVELTVDIGADVGTRLQTFTLKGTGKANDLGLPFMLGDDAAFASDYTANFAAGTIDTIERIRVKNESTTNVAKLRRIIAS